MTKVFCDKCNCELSGKGVRLKEFYTGSFSYSEGEVVYRMIDLCNDCHSALCNFLIGYPEGEDNDTD